MRGSTADKVSEKNTGHGHPRPMACNEVPMPQAARTRRQALEGARHPGCWPVSGLTAEPDDRLPGPDETGATIEGRDAKRPEPVAAWIIRLDRERHAADTPERRLRRSPHLRTDLNGWRDMGLPCPTARPLRGQRRSGGQGGLPQATVAACAHADALLLPVELQGREAPCEHQPDYSTGSGKNFLPEDACRAVPSRAAFAAPGSRNPLNRFREPARHGTGCRTRRHLLSIAALLTANGNAVMRPLRGCDGRVDLLRGSPAQSVF